MLAAAVTWLFLLVAIDAHAHSRTDHGPPRVIRAALRHAATVYRVPYAQLLAVSWCESRWDPRAWNPTPVGRAREHSQGLFGFLPSTWRRTPYQLHSMSEPDAAARAAAWLVVKDGGWREWVCRP